MEGLRFEKEIVDPKDVKKGNYVELDVNGQIKFAQVQDTFSVKNGKHGAAKTTITSKILSTGTNHQKTYTGNDTVSVYKQVKVQLKVVDADEAVITYDDGGEYHTIDLMGKMDPEEIEKIVKTVTSGESESYDLCLRALPDFYKLDSIRVTT